MVEPSNDINTEMKQIIIDTAKFLNQRLIDDSEIGFSVIYASTEVFTNKNISLINNDNKIKIKETQYLPTLTTNSLIYNYQNNVLSKFSYSSINQNIKINENTNKFCNSCDDKQKGEVTIDMLKTAAESEGFAVVPRVLFNIGRIEETRGNIDKAVESYKKLVTDYPSDQWASLAKSRIITLDIDGKVN